MSYRINVGENARRQIRDAQDWWLRNRTKAPLAFAEDIESALDLLEAVPGAGEPVSSRKLTGVRRLLLSRLRYFLYYTVDTGSRTIEILALWHTRRGRPPRL